MSDSPVLTPSLTLVKIFFFLVLLCVIVMVYGYTLIEEIEILSRTREQPIALKVRTVIPPFLFMIPAFAILIFGFLKQLVGRFSNHMQQRGIMIIICCFPLFILAWWLYSWQLNNWLEGQGYTSCPWYTGATLGAPTIWLKASDYCIEEGYPVRTELLDWLEAQRQQGTTPTVEEFKLHQEKILAQYQQKYSQW